MVSSPKPNGPFSVCRSRVCVGGSSSSEGHAGSTGSPEANGAGAKQGDLRCLGEVSMQTSKQQKGHNAGPAEVNCEGVRRPKRESRHTKELKQGCGQPASSQDVGRSKQGAGYVGSGAADMVTADGGAANGPDSCTPSDSAPESNQKRGTQEADTKARQSKRRKKGNEGEVEAVNVVEQHDQNMSSISHPSQGVVDEQQESKTALRTRRQEKREDDRTGENAASEQTASRARGRKQKGGKDAAGVATSTSQRGRTKSKICETDDGEGSGRGGTPGQTEKTQRSRSEKVDDGVRANTRKGKGEDVADAGRGRMCAGVRAETGSSAQTRQGEVSERRERATERSRVDRFTPSPIRKGSGGAKRRRRKRVREGHGQDAANAVGENENSKLCNRLYEQNLQKARQALQRLQKEEHTLAVFGAEGWKGESREKVRLTDELSRAEVQRNRWCGVIRDCVRICDEVQGFKAIPKECVQADGTLEQEHVFCAVCLGEDCEDGNDIILCDGPCDRAYHEHCMDPPVLSADLDEDKGWLCYACECKEDILELLNEELNEKYEMETSWHDILPPHPGSTADGKCDKPGTSSSGGEDESSQDADSQGEGRARRRRRRLKPVPADLVAASKNGLLGMELPSEDEEDSDFEDPGDAAAESGDNHAGSETSSSDEEADGNETSSSPGWEDEEEAGGVAGHVSEEGGEPLEALPSKRRRTTVDYRALNDVMFGGAEEVSEDDEDFAPEKQRRRKPQNG